MPRIRQEGKGISSGYDSMISPVLIIFDTHDLDIPLSNILLTA